MSTQLRDVLAVTTDEFGTKTIVAKEPAPMKATAVAMDAWVMWMDVHNTFVPFEKWKKEVWDKLETKGA